MRLITEDGSTIAVESDSDALDMHLRAMHRSVLGKVDADQFEFSDGDVGVKLSDASAGRAVDPLPCLLR